MPVKITPEYMAAARRFHDNHPEAEAAVHRAFLGGLGLSEEAQQQIVGRNAPELAHHPQIGQIGALPKSEHARAVAELHRQESSEPEGNSVNGRDNEEVDLALGDRAKRTAGHKRTPVERYR